MAALAMTKSLETEGDRQIAEAFEREGRSLRRWLRRNVPNRADAEDILQDAFYELVAAGRLLEPLGNVGGWLYRVARNKVIDRARRRTHEQRLEPAITPDGDELSLESLLPSADAGPEAAYARDVLLDELLEAVDELPPEQRAVFLAHEVQGQSFKEISAATGTSVSALLSRKHAAVLHLRRRLEDIYHDFFDEASS
jgi:RNA polymerase sigma factor (sigma-70 family)